jgi:hypothetical protein
MAQSAACRDIEEGSDDDDGGGGQMRKRGESGEAPRRLAEVELPEAAGTASEAEEATSTAGEVEPRASQRWRRRQRKARGRAAAMMLTGKRRPTREEGTGPAHLQSRHRPCQPRKRQLELRLATHHEGARAPSLSGKKRRRWQRQA